jgi:four helix bundle protein
MKQHIYSFEKLEVWSDIRNLINMIYKLTNKFPDSEKYGLINQMRRAAISVSSNLAEGASKTSAKDQANFYQMAYASLMELLSQTIVSTDLGIIDNEDLEKTRESIGVVSFKLNALRKAAIKRKN